MNHLVELRWIKRKVTIERDLSVDPKYWPIKRAISILQYRTRPDAACEFSEWRDVPEVSDAD